MRFSTTSSRFFADLDEAPEEPAEREESIVSDAVASLLAPALLDALREAASAAAEAPPAQTVEAAGPAEETLWLYYGSVDEFVRQFICPTFRRNVGQEGLADHRWSARWWQSAEAITRLEAIWRAWEHLRMDPATGTSELTLAQPAPRDGGPSTSRSSRGTLKCDGQARWDDST